MCILYLIFHHYFFILIFLIKNLYLILFSKNIDNCKKKKASNLCTKAIEWGRKKFPFPLGVVSTPFFVVVMA